VWVEVIGGRLGWCWPEGGGGGGGGGEGEGEEVEELELGVVDGLKARKVFKFSLLLRLESFDS